MDLWGGYWKTRTKVLPNHAHIREVKTEPADNYDLKIGTIRNCIPTLGRWTNRTNESDNAQYTDDGILRCVHLQRHGKLDGVLVT